MSCLNWSMAQSAPDNWRFTQIVVPWVVTLHSLAREYWHFKGTCCINIQCEDRQATSYQSTSMQARIYTLQEVHCIGCNMAMIMPRTSLGGMNLSINSFQSVNFTTVCFQASVSFSNSTFLLAVLQSFTIQNEKLHFFTFTFTLHYVCVQASHMSLWHETQSWVTEYWVTW